MGGGWWFVESVSRQGKVDRILKNPFSDDPIKYRELGPSFYFQFTFRATFDGDPVSLDQFIECRPFLASGGIGGGTYLMYQKIPEITGLVLPDGAALYFPAPHYCWDVRGHKRWPDHWRVGATVEAIPYVHWANRAENPDVIEAYVLPEYMAAEGARLRVIESRVTFMPESFTPERRTEVDPRLKTLGGWGWALAPLPAELGEAALGDIVAESPSRRITALHVPESMRETFHGRAWPVREYQSEVGYGIPINLPAVLIALGQRERLREGQRQTAGVLPIAWDGNVYYVLEDRPPGLYAFYPGYPGKSAYVTMDREDPTVIFRGEAITLPTRSVRWPHLALCDRQTGGCYQLFMLH